MLLDSRCGAVGRVLAPAEDYPEDVELPSRPSVATSAALAGALLVAGCVNAGGAVDEERDDVRPVIEVMYSFSGSLEEGFQQEVRTWARENEVDVEFAPTDNIDELITTRVQGNDPPDVAVLPDPGSVRRLAEQDVLLDLTDVVPEADQAAVIPDFLEAGRVDDRLFAVPVGLDVTSVVFYPRAAAEELGLVEPPATLEDLRALTDRIAQTGKTPWCFGAESEDPRFSPATDWLENLMLIGYGRETYDRWVQHEFAFDDPRVAEVLEQMEALLLEDGRTSGGREAVATTDGITAAAPMFADPRGCSLYRQDGSVVRGGAFPEEVVEDVDESVGVFPMPGRTPEDRPVLADGQLAGVFSQADGAARQLVQFMASPDFGRNGHGAGGVWISPRTDFAQELYPDETWRAIARIAYESTEFALDGSEQMPREVGSRSIPRELTAWISGEQDLQTMLADVEAGWPT